MEIDKILYTLHYPKNSEEFDKAKKMFAFHELFNYQLKLQLQNINSRIEDTRYCVGVNNKDINDFKNSLPLR